MAKLLTYTGIHTLPETEIPYSWLKACSHCDDNGNDFVADLFIWSGRQQQRHLCCHEWVLCKHIRLFTLWRQQWRQWHHIDVLALFLSVAIAVTKWVHNPFNNDAIAIAINHHVNSLICLHRTHSWRKKIEFPLLSQCERILLLMPHVPPSPA